MTKMIKNTLIYLIIACFFVQSCSSGIAIAKPDALRPMAFSKRGEIIFNPKEYSTQGTIARKITLMGKGLHTNALVKIVIKPAPPDTGIVFVKLSADGREQRVRSSADNLRHTKRKTLLEENEAVVMTPEHFISACYALGLHNLEVETHGDEIPIFDGSAIKFVEALSVAGRKEQLNKRVREVEIKKPIFFISKGTDGNKLLIALPHNSFKVSYFLSFEPEIAEKQNFSFDFAIDDYKEDISKAKTFGFKKHVDILRKEGYSYQGFDLENIWLISDDFILHRSGLTYSDEFARHKALDMTGDFSVLGGRIKAHIIGIRTGHRHNAHLAKFIAQQDKITYTEEELDNVYKILCGFLKTDTITSDVFLEIISALEKYYPLWIANIPINPGHQKVIKALTDTDEEILDTDPNLPDQPLAKRLVSKLKNSKQLLLYGELPSMLKGFISSNEHNLFERAMDTRKAEILIGAGSNSNWDIAIRRNTDIMVIWDINEEAIVAQEYLYKPLILIANSPAEFMSLLSGVPISEEMKDRSIEETFKYINEFWKDIERNSPKRIRSSDEYIDEIAKRIAEHPMLGAQHAIFVKRHLMYTRNLYRRYYNVQRKGLHNVFSYDLTIGYRDNPYKDFKRTYNPDWLVESGAQRTQVTAPNFSSFSSLKSFKKLKILFEQEHVYYIIGDIFKKEGYETIARLSKETGLKVSGLSIANIIDSIAGNGEEASMLRNMIIDIVRLHLDIDETFTIYETHGINSEHTYETFGIDSTADDNVSENTAKPLVNSLSLDKAVQSAA